MPPKIPEKKKTIREKAIEGHSQGWREISSRGWIFYQELPRQQHPKGHCRRGFDVIK